MYKKVVVPVDLAELEVSKPAIHRATKIIEASGGELRLMNVLSLIPAAYLDYMPANFDAQERERAEQEIKELAKSLPLPEGRVSTAVRLGAIYHEVIGEAKAWNADLIVVGSHHPTLATYLIGSNAANIVRHAHCSVLVVR
jgi:universal stress protein F